jgi:aspartyl protease family protein
VRSQKILWLVIVALVLAVVVLVSRHDEGTVGPLDTSSFASLVYLLALLILIGGGSYAMFYGRVFDALRSLAIWVVIGSLVAGVFYYRTELGRLFDMAVSGANANGPQYTASINRSVQLAQTEFGDFNVLAEVNSAPIKLLVDTGASSVVLTLEAARAAGLPVDLLRYDVTIQTAKGRSHAAAVVIDEIRIGNIVERRVPALIAQPGDLRVSLLGMSFLSRLDSFEMRGKQMVLRGRR